MRGVAVRFFRVVDVRVGRAVGFTVGVCVGFAVGLRVGAAVTVRTIAVGAGTGAEPELVSAPMPPAASSRIHAIFPMPPFLRLSSFIIYMYYAVCDADGSFCMEGLAARPSMAAIAAVFPILLRER